MASVQPVRLAYSKFEPINGADGKLAPVIFLHGLSAFKETWEGMPQHVANVTKRTAYAIDARNHGESEWNDLFSFDVNADDLIHFMDIHGIKKAILVGQSMGGMTAYKTALRWPDRVEKIVSEDMSVREISKDILDVILGHFSVIRKALEGVPSDLDEAGAKQFVMQKMIANVSPEMKAMMAGSKMYTEEDAGFLKFGRDVNGRYNLICNMDVIEKFLKNVEYPAPEPKGKFDGPACFIYGKLSPFLVGADEYYIKKFFPNAVLEGIEDVGHAVHNSKPVEFNDILLKFLK